MGLSFQQQLGLHAFTIMLGDNIVLIIMEA